MMNNMCNWTRHIGPTKPQYNQKEFKQELNKLKSMDIDGLVDQLIRGNKVFSSSFIAGLIHERGA